MKLNIFQKGWNYGQDGPGNRLLYHLQGCSFDCPWCSNPEGRDPSGVMIAKEDALLPEFCDRGAISARGLDRDICASCDSFTCLTTSRSTLISRSPHAYSIDELVDEALQAHELFYDGGGITLTGGEATLQFEGCRQLLERLKAEGVSTALETNGSSRRLPEMFGIIDHLIIDLKHWDSSRAQEIVGSRMGTSLRNIGKAAGMPGLLVRITLIPGFNDTREDIHMFGRKLKELAGDAPLRLEFLRYHEYGKSKWDAIGEEYRFPGGSISDTAYEDARRIAASYGHEVL